MRRFARRTDLALTNRHELARSCRVLGRVAGFSDTSIMSISAVRRRPSVVERGLVPEGALVVLVSINPDLGRVDANYLKIQRF